MARYVRLDNVAHRDLAVAKRYAAAHGDAVNQVLALPTEFEALQREYPILFRRDPAADGAAGWYAVALLGFARDENLFLRGDGTWDAHYVPAMRRRGPFAPGPADGDILVDLDDARVGADEAEPLFLRHGGVAPMLQRITGVLDVLRRGQAASAPLYAAWEAAGLLAPARLDIDLGDGATVSIEDVFRVDERQLAALRGEPLERLHHQGFLRAAHMAAASLDIVDRLIARTLR